MSERYPDLTSLYTDCETDGYPSRLFEQDPIVHIFFASTNAEHVCKDDSQSRSSSKRKAVSDSSSSSDGSLSDRDLSPEHSDEEETQSRDQSAIDTSCSVSSEEQIVNSLDKLFLSDDVNLTDKRGESALSSHIQTDKDGDTKLHLAFIFQKFEYVRDMLKGTSIGKYINIQNMLFQTPLHLAVVKDIHAPVDIIRDLLRAGADPTLQDSKGRTFLHVICENGDYKTLTDLLKSGSFENVLVQEYIDKHNYAGQTALQTAVTMNTGQESSSMTEIVRILLSLGADVNVRDRRSGRTALHFAAEIGNFDIVKLLVGCRDIKIAVETYNRETALTLAYHRHHDRVVQLLVNKGAVCNLHELKQFGPTRQKFRKTDA